MRAGSVSVLWALGLLAAPRALATEPDVVRFATNMSCAQYHHSEAVLQTSLYGEAYAWTEHAALKNWRFEAVAVASSGLLGNPLDAAVDPAAECVRVSYSAPVRMPAVLRTHTSLGTFRTDVEKTSCVHGNVVLNKVFVRKLPFIGTVDTTSMMTFEASRMLSVVHAQYTLPWFLRFMQQVSEDLIVKSYSEELAATMHQLCTS